MFNCSRCKKPGPVSSTAYGAIIKAKKNGWRQGKHKMICPDCFTSDDLLWMYRTRGVSRAIFVRQLPKNPGVFTEILEKYPNVQTLYDRLQRDYRELFDKEFKKWALNKIKSILDGEYDG